MVVQSGGIGALCRLNPDLHRGDIWAYQTETTRTRIYWPVGILRPDGEGGLTVAESDWADAYDDGLRQFLERSRRLARLSHPYLGRIGLISENDLAATQGPPVRRSLADWLAAGLPSSPDLVLDLAAQIGQGLSAAHQKDILHLGLSPDLIGLDTGKVQIHDFGGDLRPYVSLRKSREGFFQPAYQPVEALDNMSDDPLTPAADIYGVCALLYRVITGRDPPASYAFGSGDWLRLQDEAKACPSDLIQAIDRGLSRRPDERPESIADWLSFADLADRTQPEVLGLTWPEGSEAIRAPDAQEPSDETAPEQLDAAEAVSAQALPGPLAETRDDIIGTSPESGGRRRMRPQVVVGLVVAALGVVVTVGLMSEGLVSAKVEPRLLPEGPYRCVWDHGDVVNDDDYMLLCGDVAGSPTDRQGVWPMGLLLNDVPDAQAGDTQAMARLGLFYLRNTTAYDMGRARKWLLRSAEAGDVDGMLLYARHLEYPSIYSSGGPGLDVEDAFVARDAATDAAATDPADSLLHLRASLSWYSTARDAVPSALQLRRAREGIWRVEEQILYFQNSQFEGCWEREVAGGGPPEQATIAIRGDQLTFQIGDFQWIEAIDQPREDGRMVTRTVNTNFDGGVGGRYVFEAIEGGFRQTFVSTGAVSVWRPCSAGAQ